MLNLIQSVQEKIVNKTRVSLDDWRIQYGKDNGERNGNNFTE